MRKLSVQYQFCLALAVCLVGFVCGRQISMQTDDSSTAEEEPISRITQWIKSFLGLSSEGEKDDRGKRSMVKWNDMDSPGTNGSLPDGVFIDWRKSNCFNPPSNQGICKSCAVFAVFSLYEWAFCQLHGSKIDFSKQYAVDCLSQKGIDVCNNGTRVMDVSNFVDEYGFELARPYAYKDGNHECPYNNLTETKQTRGLIHLNRPYLRMIQLSQFEEQLKKGPFVASFNVGKKFERYVGGVDTGPGCEERFAHGMLIVGSGRENGEEYWILRNSFGVNWGENGYYRLKKINDCYHDEGLGWVLDGSFGSDDDQTASYKTYSNQLKFTKNPNYDWKLISEKLNVKEEPIIPWKEV